MSDAGHIEDRAPDPETLACEHYNKGRAASGLRPLTLAEFADRCRWMATYQDTSDKAERAAAARSLALQDGRLDEHARPRTARRFGTVAPPEMPGDALDGFGA